VSQKHPELGKWVANLRQKYKVFIDNDTLKLADGTIQYRVQKLNEIGFEFFPTRLVMVHIGGKDP
jgi:hypothetical protein